MNLRQIIGLAGRVVVGGVLIYSGFSKAVAPSAEFAAAMAAYHILPSSLLSPLAIAWPWLELLVGTYIFFGFYTRIFAGVATGMFVIFLAILGSALARHIDPGSCGCFGIGITLSIQKGLAFDSGLFVLSLLLSVLSSPPLPLSADRWTGSNHV
jgi:uncharacterized membrane protein YphA (DoxX/SURF4 family)